MLGKKEKKKRGAGEISRERNEDSMWDRPILVSNLCIHSCNVTA